MMITAPAPYDLFNPFYDVVFQEHAPYIALVVDPPVPPKPAPRDPVQLEFDFG